MLIFRRRRSLCRSLLWERRLPVGWLEIAATRSLFNYHTYKTNNRWVSIDAHFQDGAGSMMLLFLTLKAANTWFMNGCNHSPRRIPKMHSQNSLTLSWRSVDAPLTLIFTMGQWPCGLLFCPKRLPACWVWIAPTTSPFKYHTYKTQNRGCSIDAHFQDGAGSMML